MYTTTLKTERIKCNSSESFYSLCQVDIHRQILHQTYRNKTHTHIIIGTFVDVSFFLLVSCLQHPLVVKKSYDDEKEKKNKKKEKNTTSPTHSLIKIPTNSNAIHKTNDEHFPFHSCLLDTVRIFSVVDSVSFCVCVFFSSVLVIRVFAYCAHERARHIRCVI